MISLHVHYMCILHTYMRERKRERNSECVCVCVCTHIQKPCLTYTDREGCLSKHL